MIHKMHVVQGTVSVNELKELAKNMYGNLVKAVVDIEQELMVIDAELHADQEEYLLEQYESQQSNLWGINLHPDKFGTPEFVEFDSMINMRPGEGNPSRSVENPQIQKIIRAVVMKKVA